MTGGTGVAAAALVAVGFGCGVGIRLLLGRLRRGAIVRPGPIELACAVTLLVGLLVLGRSWWLLPTGFLALLGVAASAVDLKHHRIPDALTYPALVLGALVVTVSRLFGEIGSPLRALIAAAAIGAVFAGLALLGGGMGWGDVKLVVTLAGVAGMHSWSAVMLGLVGSFVLAAVVAVIGIAARRWTLKSRLPFGPALAVAFWGALLSCAATVVSVG